MSHGLSHDVTTVHDRRLVLKQSGLLKDYFERMGTCYNLHCCEELGLLPWTVWNENDFVPAVSCFPQYLQRLPI